MTVPRVSVLSSSGPAHAQTRREHERNDCRRVEHGDAGRRQWIARPDRAVQHADGFPVLLAHGLVGFPSPKRVGTPAARLAAASFRQRPGTGADVSTKRLATRGEVELHLVPRGHAAREDAPSR